MAEINKNTHFWRDGWLIFICLCSTVWITYSGSHEIRQKLEPRRQRLADLLAALNTSK
jgi:hypothetical protein